MIFLLIRRMTATFGSLQGRTLELREGLNILEAPNETGKSTWCAFLLSMLYGINSRERDRAGFIADKNRYAPWSGAAMSGRLDCLFGGEELTLLRTTRRQTAPLGEFQAVYAGTGDTVPGLTGQTCGETLLGVSREVFERSAFIRQSGLAISQDPGLERRIASLISTGEEDTSYMEAAEALKKQLNRRRHNKTGQLPALEAELEETERHLVDFSALETQLSTARVQVEALTGQEAALTEELSALDRWEAQEKRRTLREAEVAAAAAEAHAAALRRRLEEERVPENETIGRLRGAIVNLETVRRSVSKAMAEKDDAFRAAVKAETAVSASPFMGRTVEEARRTAQNVPPIHSKAWWFPILLLAVGAGGTFLLGSASGDVYPPWAIIAMGGVSFLLGILAVLRREQADRKKQAAYLAGFGVASTAELSAAADAYTLLHQAHTDAQNAVVKATGVYDALYASLTSNEQGILLEVRRFAPTAFDIPAADQLLRGCAVRRRELQEAEAAARDARMRYELQSSQLPTAGDEDAPLAPPRPRETVSADLDETRAALSAARSTADQLSGRLHALGDPVVLGSQRARLQEQRETLEGEYQAIRLAMEALDSANTTLQSRFSPALGRRAAEIFAELTQGRYGGVVLDRSFRLAAEPAGAGVYRDAALLSAGAADQLYLAVRLAICDLVLPRETAVPILLDDALSNFDDGRCAAALRWLKAAAKQRQILLFTCHSREADFFRQDGEVSVQRLTEPDR